MSQHSDAFNPMTRHPDPRAVPNYEAARAAGLLPVVPSQPPKPVVMNSNRVSMGMVVAFFTGIAMLMISDMQGPLFVFAAVFVFGVLIAGVAAPSALTLREYAAGYCRGRDWVGMPPMMIGKQNGAGPAGCQWDARGLWLLGANGQVVEPPNPAFLPPGKYPCNDSGDWDLWTGAQWLGRPKPGPSIGSPEQD